MGVDLVRSLQTWDILLIASWAQEGQEELSQVEGQKG